MIDTVGAVIAPVVSHLLNKADKMPTLKVTMRVLQKIGNTVKVSMFFDASAEVLVQEISFEGFAVNHASDTTPMIVKETGSVDHITNMGYKKIIARVTPKECQYVLTASGEMPQLLVAQVTTESEKVISRAVL